jgi:hypothetical protein
MESSPKIATTPPFHLSSFGTRMSIQPLSAKNQPGVIDPPNRPGAVARARNTNRRLKMTYVVIAFWLFGLACLFASSANGQEPYKRVALNSRLAESPKMVKDIYLRTKNFADGRDADIRYVKAYFKNYIPAILTNDDRTHEAAKVMKNYYALLEKSKNGRNRNAITDLVLTTMGPMAVGNYPPRARINAIHALAKLDSQPANRSASTPPVPLAKTLPLLVRLYRDKNNVDGVRAAALHGIHRHVQYGFPKLSADMKSGLATIMNQLLSEEVPLGRSPDAHAYLQRFAVDILETLRAKGDSALGEKLILISTEKSQPDLIALHSAAGIAAIGSDLKDKVANPSKVLESWSRRALSVMESELDRLKSLDRADGAAGQPPAPGDYESGGSSRSSSGGTKRKKSGGGLSGLSGLRGGGGSSRARSSKQNDVGDHNANSGGLSALGGGGGGNRGDRRGRKKTERRKDPVPGENQPPEVVASRRKLNYAFQQLKLGATGTAKPGLPARASGGLYAVAAEDARSDFQQWVSDLQDIVDEVNSEYLESRREYVEMLESQIEIMRETVGDEPAAEPAEKPAEKPAERPAELAAEPEVAAAS